MIAHLSFHISNRDGSAPLVVLFYSVLIILSISLDVWSFCVCMC